MPNYLGDLSWRRTSLKFENAKKNSSYWVWLLHKTSHVVGMQWRLRKSSPAVAFVVSKNPSQASTRTLVNILGDPGADSGGEGKSKRAGKYGTKKSKEWWVEPLGTTSYQTSSKPSPPENVCVFLPNQKAERRRPFGTSLVRHCPQGLFLPFFTFLRAIFFLPFRLSLAPTVCPWVSEDASLIAQVPNFWKNCGKINWRFFSCTVPFLDRFYCDAKYFSINLSLQWQTGVDQPEIVLNTYEILFLLFPFSRCTFESQKWWYPFS